MQRRKDQAMVGLIPVRIANSDCAESGTAAGERSTTRAKQLVANQTVQCRLEGRRSYDRELGVCSLEGGQDYGEVLISEGICGVAGVRKDAEACAAVLDWTE